MKDRTTLRREPHKQVRDRAPLDALLDAALVAHVGVLDDGVPLSVPTAVARDGDRLLVHGSSGSRAFRWLATGAPTSVTVTITDGVVIARSRFNSSMHFRSAMLYGTFTLLSGDAQAQALETFSRVVFPGVEGQREANRKELAATTILAMPITEWSLKVSDAPPGDELSDLGRRVWAGVVPIRHVWGPPVDAPHLSSGLHAPEVLATWPAGRT